MKFTFDEIFQNEVVDRGERLDWSGDCGGYPILFDPVAVTDAILDKIHRAWNLQTTSQLLLSPYVQRREMAVISWGANAGLKLRVTSGDLTHEERRQCNHSFAASLHLRGSRLGVMTDWRLRFSSNALRDLFRPCCRAEIGVPAGDYQVVASVLSTEYPEDFDESQYQRQFVTGDVSDDHERPCELVVQLSPAKTSRSALPSATKVKSRPNAKKLPSWRFSPPLSCGENELCWVCALSQFWVGAAPLTGCVRAHWDFCAGAQPSQITYEGALGLADNGPFADFVAQGLESGRASGEVRLVIRLPARPTPAELVFTGRVVRWRLQVAEMQWDSGRIVRDGALFDAALRWLIGSRLAYREAGPDRLATGAQVWFTLESIEPSHQLAVALAARGNEVDWRRERLAADPLVAAMIAGATGSVLRAARAEPFGLALAAVRPWPKNWKTLERLTAEKIARLKAEGWDALRAKLDVGRHLARLARFSKTNEL
jgi:hypothetical protein